MRAAVALQARGQSKPVTVAVYSENEQTDGADAWGCSDHQVYRLALATHQFASLFKISQHAEQISVDHL